jgi:hypothetical protein
MKRSLITGSLITVLISLVCIGLTGIGYAEDPSGARPMFVTLPPHSAGPGRCSPSHAPYPVDLYFYV